MEYAKVFIFISFVEDKIPEEEITDANKPAETGDEKVLDLNQIHLINDSTAEKKHEKNGLSDSSLPNQTVQTSSMNGTNISKDGDEIHNEENDAFANGNNVRENVENSQKSSSNCDDKHKTFNKNPTEDELCLNGENIKKTRKNGVYAIETSPNGEINEITKTTQRETAV